MRRESVSESDRRVEEISCGKEENASLKAKIEPRREEETNRVEEGSWYCSCE